MNTRKALVVGIGNYGNGNDLKSPINDANEISELLAHNENGEPNFEVKKKLNVSTREELNQLVQKCFSNKKADENIEVSLFYFSGHGFQDAYGGYLVTPDCKNYNMGLSMGEIINIMDAATCLNKVVILDCCYSGKLGNSSTSHQGAAVINNGITILTSSEGDEESYTDINGHGVFTALLIDALKGGAADITGFITPAGVYSYIDKALGPYEQRPLFKTNVSRFVPLRTVTPQVDIATLRRLVQHFTNPDEQFQLNPSFEYTNTLTAEHKVLEPYADDDNVAIFKDLQKYVSLGLVVPCGSPYMYFAAMESKSCKLTSVGKYYWRLIKNNNL